MEKKCRAKLVLGTVSPTWATCKIRVAGTCCKDCEEFQDCQIPCVYTHSYVVKLNGVSSTSSECGYYLTEIEALLKRISEGGIRL